MLFSVIIIAVFILIIALVGAFIGDSNPTLVAILGVICGIIFVGICVKLSFYFRREAKSERCRNKNGYKIYPRQWFLRWYEPNENEYYMIKDKNKYIADKINWETHNKLRLIYLEELIALDNETGLNHKDELYNYYLGNVCSEKYLKIIERMEDSGVTLLYRPEVDYLVFGGPLWSDCPERSRTNIYTENDRIFVITEDNINSVVMDHKKYYKDKYVKDGVNMREINTEFPDST